jgi:glycosyltransferase involved in cell wall biosynthesis
VFEIWFWQRIVSPHMAHLAVALARRGCKVTYVAEEAMSADRQQQGWAVPELPGMSLLYADSDAAIQTLAQKPSEHSIHICQGIRSNGFVGAIQRELSARRLRQWVVMETVDDSGWRGLIKRMEYSRLVRARRDSLQGVLAIGHRTMDWVVARGVPAERVHPFAYFLPDPKESRGENGRAPGVFRFVFVGQLISRKRVDWLLNALIGISDQEFELLVVGTGPEEPALRQLAARRLGDRVRWLGRLPMNEVPAVMAQADCLVLPSVHDGWGAVISESLMVGTPVICSDACGAAGVVRASGFGGVFPQDQGDVLKAMLDKQVKASPIDAESRARLATWATALGADAGASYLLSILECMRSGGKRPMPPWQTVAKQYPRIHMESKACA